MVRTIGSATAASGAILLLMAGLISCGKQQAPAAAAVPAQTVAPPPALAPHPEIPKDAALNPSVAASRLAGQMDRGDAARCGAVFASVGDALKRSGDAGQAKRVASYQQAVRYLAELPMPDHSAPPQHPDIQAAVKREAAQWNAMQRDANLNYCFGQFGNLHSLLEAAGEIKKK